MDLLGERHRDDVVEHPGTRNTAVASVPRTSVGPCATSEGSALATATPAPVWTPQSTGTSANLFGAAAPSFDAAWLVGDSGTILRTDDRGATWAAQTSNTGHTLSGHDHTKVAGSGG